MKGLTEMNIVEYYVMHFPSKINSSYDERYFSDVKRYPREWMKLQSLEYIDDKQVITEWKSCLYPANVSFVSKIEFEKAKYYFLSYYLWSEGYSVKEFPSELESTLGLENFADRVLYDATANKYGRDSNGNVKWRHRRLLIDSLSIIKKDTIITIEEKVDELIKNISTRSAKFEHMTTDEKLENIRNGYDHIIKLYGGFDKIDYHKLFMSFIEESNLKNYSKKLHAFRHGDAVALVERAVYTDQEKKYMIDFGITVLNRLWNNLK